MKEIPILMSTPMVQAILQGRKTKTRRIIKASLDDRGLRFTNRWEDWHGNKVKCPYGQPGGLLWVRETHAITFSTAPSMKQTVWYKADNPVIPERISFKWHPSIHMPKGAARIWLQVTDVRVERLQGISEEDAKAEGVMPAHCETNQGCPSLNCKDQCCEIGNWWNYRAPDGEGFPAFSARSSFESLWETINGIESLKANPWVWVISFEVLSTTGRPNPHPISKIS